MSTIAAAVPKGFIFEHRPFGSLNFFAEVTGLPVDAGSGVVYIPVRTLTESFFGPAGTETSLAYMADRVLTEAERPATRFRVVIEFDTDAPPDRAAEAVRALAEVMAVQAEDGLYTLGYEEAEGGWVEGPGDAPGYEVENEYLGAIGNLTIHTEVAK